METADTLSLLIRNALFVTGAGVFRGDCLLEKGRIVALGPNLAASAAEVIDAENLAVFPGVIDSHVHLREPGAEHKEDFRTGTRSAAAGGVTTVLDMPNNHPPTITLDALAEKRRRAAGNCLVDYGFYFGFTGDNCAEMEQVRNIAGIKLFLGASTGELLVTDQHRIERLFRETSNLIAVHSEKEELLEKASARNTIHDHTNLRPPAAEAAAVRQMLELARKTRHRVHLLHISSAKSIRELERAQRPPLVTVEVTPHHLWCAAPEAYESWGNFAKTNPPIRGPRDRQALWQALMNGTINIIGSDHAPHTREEKNRPYWQAPAGIPGVETLLPALLTAVARRRLQLTDIPRFTAENPARLFGIKGKGFLQVGYDADLVLVDLKAAWQVEDSLLHSRAGWSLFSGIEFQGRVIMTLVRGQVVYREGEFPSPPIGKEVEFKV